MREIDAKNPPWARIKAHGGLSFDLRKEKLEKLAPVGNLQNTIPIGGCAGIVTDAVEDGTIGPKVHGDDPTGAHLLHKIVQPQ